MRVGVTIYIDMCLQCRRQSGTVCVCVFMRELRGHAFEGRLEEDALRECAQYLGRGHLSDRLVR